MTNNRLVLRTTARMMVKGTYARLRSTCPLLCSLKKKMQKSKGLTTPKKKTIKVRLLKKRTKVPGKGANAEDFEVRVVVQEVEGKSRIVATDKK
jgi:hypothetical protein